MNKLVTWYHDLSEREQIILQIAAPLALLLLLLILLNTGYQNQTAQKTRHQQLLQDYQWLQTKTLPIGLWQADFGRRNLGKLNEAAELGLLLNNGLSKFSIRGSVTANNSGGWQVNINPSDGNRVLSFIEAAVGSGAIPRQIKLTRADTKGRVSGHLIFTPLLAG